jgi:hypothetical protein
MLARGVLGRLGAPLVHAYFHDTDLLDRRRRIALAAALAVLGRRRRPGSFELADAPELPFSAASAP